ncbi:MAG: sterol desaturase family protein [Lewinella sp.]|jgi:sterol desaturase/sphingolipid hydroxylase (fatty acid hydroxylase superfamily)|uniref:sterol desaturase family protein n=1 Tax=Lewinella sp. TaxID=2004506 RepID=UPI003D6B9888
MEKPIFTVEQILSMDLPPLIIWAAPVMFFLVFLEWYIRTRELKQDYDGKDGFSAFIIGVGNIGVSALVKTLTFGIILYFYNVVPWFIPPTWWSYILCMLAIDFCRYWAHRIAHEQRMWWATHVTHHNSEQYNFTVGFRLSWTQHLKIIFFIPVALMGFHPVVFFIANQIEVLYQFWIHTELIKKMPRPIEYIFVTPSHHRVHHGTNDKYLDKNYGSTLIIWDRIFGTFQGEEEKVSYGILTQVNSYNPVWLVFHEWVAIFKDMATYRTPRAWWRILFGGPNMTMDKDHYYGGKEAESTSLLNTQIRRSKDEK